MPGAAPPVLIALGLVRCQPSGFRLDVSGLRLEEGWIHAVLGANGAGKTTLVEVLAGLRRPDRGELRLDGDRVGSGGRGLRSYRRRIALVPQNPFFFRGTAAWNLELGLRLRGVGRAEARTRAVRALAELGLAGVGGRQPAELSGGQQRCLAVARALALEPRLLLLDEPFANLDDGNRVRLVESLLRARDRGRSAILVTAPIDLPGLLGVDRRWALVGGMLTEPVPPGVGGTRGRPESPGSASSESAPAG